MHDKVQKYINKILVNDESLTAIFLEHLNITDADIARLMSLLLTNKEIAQQITHIYLGGNQLTIAPLLTGLVNLKHLSLYDNKIRFPPVLIGLKKLEVVHLFKNELGKPPILTDLAVLKELSLQQNKLTSVPVLTDCVALEKLNLSENLLTHAPILTGLLLLRSLHLDQNQITVPPDLTGLAQLWHFTMFSNKLIFPPILTGLNKLSDLMLNMNNLTTAPVLSGLKSLEEVYLTNNPLTVATKIALQIYSSTLANRRKKIHYDKLPTSETALTIDILNKHYNTMLASTSQGMIEYLQNIGAVGLLSHGLPRDIVNMIGEYLYEIRSIPQIRRTLSNMADFESIFTNMAIQSAVANNQLNILKTYIDTVLSSNLKKIEKNYVDVLKSKPVIGLALLIDFLRKYGFDPANLDKQNNNGFIPLALAEKMANNSLLASEKATAAVIIPLIKRRTSYKGLVFNYVSTCCENVSDYIGSELPEIQASFAKLNVE